MTLQVSALRVVDGSVPGVRGLIVLVTLFSVLAWRGLRRAPAPEPRPADRSFRMALLVYFATFVAIAVTFDPSTHRSASLHQTYGPCHVQATDFTGATRDRFACAADADRDYSFDCEATTPVDGADWYTVCGRPYTNRPLWLGALALLGLAGAFLYSRLLRLTSSP
jgi:hypothetical protein